ncbi:sensor histidine kinase [Dactylosporangium matsuzakiense]|uniref:histidine kinase n=1 Tax=Dactylosporangium matsuzakiense TaxID=53360 RepID=A0A9W6KU92_9ACTN|nr:sensor histidine kinase [Dactylosporangium matsuzakiense]UWZ47629.1 CHASE3 domain-containing protein [Dactylosporangium matsuzakiense]GLL05574.1 histidine kinase [Dactylosporangium matsuzakiense]
MTDRRRLTSQRLFALTIGAMTLLIVLGSWAGYASLADTTRVSDRLQQQISPAATAAVELGAALVDQETAVRGFVLAREQQFLDPYNEGVATERRLADRLRGLLADEPAALKGLETVERAAAGWRNDFAQPLIASPDPRSPLVVTSKSAFDGIRGGIAALQQRVDEARAAGRHALDTSRQRRDTIFAIIVGGLLAGLFVIALLLQRSIFGPLDRLRTAVRTVADGDFEHRVPAVGPADLAALGESVEAMRERVVTALAESRAQEERLRRSNSDLEQFAYVASHDLQEPLRKIASFCQMLQRRYADQLDDRARQYIAFAVDGATRMQALINDLLAFSRVGRVYDNVTDVDLAATMRRVRNDLAVRLEDTDATVETPDLPVVQGDPTLLAMLWQNLISNAVKFRKPDVPPKITVELSEADGFYEFAVHDNGIGIEPQYADKIFIIFQRLHPRDVYPGTGIGLAICKRIVEHHGGRIWLDPTYTDGAGIRFTLPVPAPEPVTA